METVETHVIFFNKFIFAVLAWKENERKVYVKYYYNGRECNTNDDKEKEIIDNLSMEALKYCISNGLKLYSY